METRVDNTNALAASLARDLERIHRTGTPTTASATPAASCTPAQPLESASQLYCAFENEFRGDSATITGRQAEYLPTILKAAAACQGMPILDVGCGRGEFLQLMRQNNIPANGVDIDQAMVERCLAQGLDVSLGTFESVLDGGKDGDLAGVVAFQVVEHIGFAKIVELIKSSHSRTAPGGVLILETVNPASFTSLRDFYLDPTHRNPIPSATLEFIVRSCGYRDVSVVYTSQVKPSRLLSGSDSNTAKLNALLFGPRDYAVVGWR